MRFLLALLCLVGLVRAETYQDSALLGRARAETYQDPKAKAFYEAHPDFFRFAKPGDLPKDLAWKDGSEQKEFADPRAVCGGVLRQFMSSTPPTLRRVGPNANNGFRGELYDNNDFGLLAAHPNTDEAIPALAISWAMSADGLTAYFRLDPNAKFTDGQPITADDFFFTFYFHRSPWAKADWYADHYAREWGGITKFDDHTIAIKAPRKRPYQLELLGGLRPTPRQFFKDFGPNYEKAYNDRFQPTTGPYYVNPEDFVREKSLTLTRVTDWWGDRRKYYRHRFNPAAIHYGVIRDLDSAYNSMLAGEIDFMPIMMPRYWYGTNEKKAYQQGYLTKAQFFNDIPRPPYGLYLNTQRPMLSDLNVRIGLQHATDFQRVIDGFYRGDYERLQQFSEGLGKFTDPSIRVRRYSPELARAAFAKAGFTREGPDGILTNAAGERLSFRLTFDTSDRRKYLATLVESARRCGVELRPETLEHTTMYRKVMEKNHDIVFWAWSVSSRLPQLWESHHAENAVEVLADGRKIPKRQTNNITGVDDPELSKLIDRFRDATEEDEMIRLSFAMQRRIHDLADFIPGFRVPGYRIAHWNWVKFPEGFDVRAAEDPGQHGLFWLDPAQREADLKDFREGKVRGSPKTVIEDRWRTE
jgi:microcin C transport system substrate-binding protein